MTLNYQKMKDYLDKRFEYFEGKTKGFYFNELGQVVATKDKKVITAFYERIDNTNQKPSLYKVSVIKSLYVGKDDDKKVIDAMYIEKNLQNKNDINVNNNFAPAAYHNEELNNEKIGAIGIALKGKSNKMHFINEELDIEIPKKEFQERNLFTLYGVYLLNLKTKYKTNKLDYEKVSEYYETEKEELNSNNSYLIKKYGMPYIEERQHQSYDGLMHPIIRKTQSDISKQIKEQRTPKINSRINIDLEKEKVKKKAI